MNTETMKKSWLWVLLLLIFVGAVYSPSLRGGFVNDDRSLIEARAPLFDTPGAYRVLPFKVYWWGTPYDPDAWRYYRPWVSLTFWAEYKIGGLKPYIFHLSNWLVHLANTVLIFILMRTILGGWLALGVATLSAICPTALTSVGWISGRTDLWATFFILLFLLAFRAARKTSNSWPHIAASLAFLGGLASKEVAIVAPVLAYALDRFTPESDHSQAASRRPVWHYFLLIIPLGIYFILRTISAGEMLPKSVGLLTFLRGIPFLAEQYLRTLFSIVIPLHYNFFTGLTWSLPGHRGIVFVLGWLVFLLLIILVIRGLWRRQLWAIGGLWIGLVLFPAYGLNRSFAPISDFYVYMALPGFWLMMVCGLHALMKRSVRQKEIIPRILGFTIAPAVVLFTILTVIRLPLLATDLSLWSHMAQREPASEFVASNLSEAYHLCGNEPQAYNWALRATELDSTAWVPHHNLANFYLDQMDIYGAAPHVDALAEFAPNRFESQAVIARFYYSANHCTLAVATYRRAFELGPPTPEVLLGFSNALSCIQDNSAAIEVIKTALLLKPDWPVAYNNMGIFYENLEDFDNAIKAQKKALQLDPNMIVSYESLAILYVKKGDSSAARQAAKKFLSLNPPPKRIERMKQLAAETGMDTTIFVIKEEK